MLCATPWRQLMFLCIGLNIGAKGILISQVRAIWQLNWYLSSCSCHCWCCTSFSSPMPGHLAANADAVATAYPAMQQATHALPPWLPTSNSLTVAVYHCSSARTAKQHQLQSSKRLEDIHLKPRGLLEPDAIAEWHVPPAGTRSVVACSMRSRCCGSSVTGTSWTSGTGGMMNTAGCWYSSQSTSRMAA